MAIDLYHCKAQAQHAQMLQQSIANVEKLQFTFLMISSLQRSLTFLALSEAFL